MALTTPEGARFSLSIMDIPKGVPLKKTDQILKGLLKSAGNKIKLISNKSMTLTDQSPAFKSTFEWKFLKIFNLRTQYVSMYKKRKWVYISYSYDPLNRSSREIFERDLEQLIKGLTF